MIQSGKFDSSDMDIKKLSNTALTFITNRLIEIFGICVLLIGVLIFIALISYSPEDPNFIFPENTIIKNVLGYQGSVTSDFIFQSIGLIGYFLPITYIFTGLSIFRKKEILVIIENTFFITIYALFGSLFFSKFYSENFTLFINGSGGFVGNYLSENFLINLLNRYEDFSYYLLLLFSLFFGGIAFFKMEWLDRLNRLLIIGLVMAFLFLITSSVPHIKVSNFSGGQPWLALSAIPVVVTSFTSHIILPSMRHYLDNNLQQLKKAILIGCGIPLLFYLTWEIIILGLLPYAGEYSLLSILQSQEEGLSLLIEYLNYHYQVNHFSELVALFSFFAIATSFWGVMISLKDFIEDGLELNQYQYHNLYAITLAFLPPLFMVLLFPSDFTTFLHYAGIIILLLYGVLPIYLVYRARYTLKLQSPYQFPGGKPSLILISLLTILVFLSTWLNI